MIKKKAVKVAVKARRESKIYRITVPVVMSVMFDVESTSKRAAIEEIAAILKHEWLCHHPRRSYKVKSRGIKARVLKRVKK